jgi:hypothetical protein
LFNLIPSSFDPSLPLERNICQVINLIPSSVDPTLSLKSEVSIAHVFLVNTDSTLQGGISPPNVEPPPSNETIIFYWHGINESRLLSYVPFQITLQVSGRDIPQIIVDEGASISILPSTTWQDLGCPQLLSVTHNLLSFNKQITQPLGILPQLPVTLGGKKNYIDVMVVHDPLDFTFLLG